MGIKIDKKIVKLSILVVIIIMFIALESNREEKKNLCYPTERYHMAESYRPGGDYKDISGDSSISYSGVVRVFPECKRGSGLDIEFWFGDKEGFYTLDTRLKVKTDYKGEFMFKTGEFLKGFLPYHIHYKVTGPGIRPMSGTYYPVSEKSGGYIDITILKANAIEPADYLTKPPSSGESLDQVKKRFEKESNDKIKNIENKEIIYLIVIIIFSLLAIVIFKNLAITSLILLLLSYSIFIGYKSNVYRSKLEHVNKIENYSIPETKYKIASWVPVEALGRVNAIEKESKILEQPNMYTQALLSDLSVIEVEERLRKYYYDKKYKLTESAVNQWGKDSHWVNGINFSAITLGNEVSITISKTLGGGENLPDGYKSMIIIWSSKNDSISKYIVDNYRGYGSGFIDIEKF